jgi:hypothetical protein
MNEMVEKAIEETVARAKTLLKKDKKKGEQALIGAHVFQFVLRRVATADEARRGGAFDFKDTTYIYDADWGTIYLEGARAGDSFCDRVICTAAALMLRNGITNPELRLYVEKRLIEGAPSIGKRERGRSKRDNAHRDVIIVGRLIPPLLDRFDATRNETTKDKGIESACSIVQKALANIGFQHMSESTVVTVWEKRPPSMRAVPIK